MQQSETDMAPNNRRGGKEPSLADRQKQFAEKYFPGGGAFKQPVITLHDAAHDFTGYSTSSYGEALQQIADQEGSRLLFGKTGAAGVVNSLTGFNPDPQEFQRVKNLGGDIFAIPRTILVNPGEDVTRRVQKADIDSYNRSVPGKGNLGAPRPPTWWLDDVNDPSRRFSPRITPEDAARARAMGREFYGKVASAYNADSLSPLPVGVDQAHKKLPFNNGVEPVGLTVNKPAAYIHENPDRIRFRGGAKPGDLAAGNIMQHVQPPLHLGIDENLFRRHAGEALLRRIGNSRSNDPGRLHGLVRQLTGDNSDLTNFSVNVGRRSGEREIERLLRGGGRGSVSKQQMDAILRSSIAKQVANDLPAWMTEVSPGAQVSALKPSIPRGYIGNRIAATVREVGRVKNAAKSVAGSTVRIAGTVPWLDLDFRQALERNDPAAALKIAGRDLAVGAATAPAAGLIGGLTQRLAPRLAGPLMNVMRAVGSAATRLNVPAAVSMLPGDTPVRGPGADPRRQAYERKTAQGQLGRAKAARKRGGRWRVGPFTVPELGFSESGGLFFP